MHARPLCCDFDGKGLGEPTLDELLAEPTVRLLMTRDGVDENALRQLAVEIRSRLAATRAPLSRVPVRSASERRPEHAER